MTDTVRTIAPAGDPGPGSGVARAAACPAELPARRRRRAAARSAAVAFTAAPRFGLPVVATPVLGIASTVPATGASGITRDATDGHLTTQDTGFHDGTVHGAATGHLTTLGIHSSGRPSS